MMSTTLRVHLKLRNYI